LPQNIFSPLNAVKGLKHPFLAGVLNTKNVENTLFLAKA